MAVTLGGWTWPGPMIKRRETYSLLLVTLPAAQSFGSWLVSHRDSFKSTGQLARGLQRWYLMNFSGFSKTLI